MGADFDVSGLFLFLGIPVFPAAVVNLFFGSSKAPFSDLWPVFSFIFYGIAIYFLIKMKKLSDRKFTVIAIVLVVWALLAAKGCSKIDLAI